MSAITNYLKKKKKELNVDEFQTYYYLDRDTITYLNHTEPSDSNHLFLRVNSVTSIFKN
jgi:hypothetical protein